MTISTDMIDAVKVQFIKPIFEDDFAEKGMTAWLTDVIWAEGDECYELYFDFFEFEAENAKYFKPVYYGNRHTTEIEDATGRELFTAIETGNYDPKYTAYFSVQSGQRNDAEFAKEIKKYLREVE
jgi:hypothetical protein